MLFVQQRRFGVILARIYVEKKNNAITFLVSVPAFMINFPVDNFKISLKDGIKLL